jgi:hypothetical protein
MRDGNRGRQGRTLVKRIESLAELHSRGIVTGGLLGSQLLKLLSSPEAREMFGDEIESDSRALRIHYRLINPSGWRHKSGLSREDRLREFMLDLEGVMSSSLTPDEKLREMLVLTCLPFFKGFIAPKTDPGAGRTPATTSRVSVLD